MAPPFIPPPPRGGRDYYRRNGVVQGRPLWPSAIPKVEINKPLTVEQGALSHDARAEEC